MSGIRSAALALTLSALGLSGLAPPQDTAVTAAPPFSVVPDAKGTVELGAVLTAFERATGWRLTMDEETRDLAGKVSFFASGPIECGRDDAPRVFAAILASQDFAWAVVRDAEAGVLSITSLDTVARGTVREGARYVPLEELADFAGSQGLLIQTLLPLPRTDVRTLSNSMRSLIVDPNLQQVIPAGDSNALVLLGFAPAVVDLGEMSREAARASAGAEPLPPGSHPPALHGASGEHTLPGAADDSAEMTLLDLVRMHARATGQIALIYPATARQLERSRLGLRAPVTVAGDAFPTLCEELLRARGFALVDRCHGGPCLYEVEHLSSGARHTLRMDARYVDAGSLELCERRPATMFQTLVTLPHTDVRALSNSMRSMVVDPSTFQVIPLGNWSSLVIQGFGRQLADLARMLRRLDATAAEAAADAPPVGAGEGDEEDGR